MSRLYDMDPQIVKSIMDELKIAAAPKDWIKKFLDDPKIKRTIQINDGFFNKVNDGSVSLES